jgi:FdhD protein
MGVSPWWVVRYQGGRFESVEDVVVEEAPLTLYVNGREIVTLLTLGEHSLELALGFLRSEGFFRVRDEVQGWREEPGAVRVELAAATGVVERLLERRTVTTGCGKGTSFYRTLDALQCRPVASPASFDAETLLRRMGELQKRSGLYRETGGTHNASLADREGTGCFRTDIGRHNAVDMLGGWALLEGAELGEMALLTTGRVSSEILIKVARMGVPVLASRSAPTALALRLARELDVTVVGYVRNTRFNVYTHARRIEGAGALHRESGGADG